MTLRHVGVAPEASFALDGDVHLGQAGPLSLPWVRDTQVWANQILKSGGGGKKTLRDAQKFKTTLSEDISGEEHVRSLGEMMADRWQPGRLRTVVM